MMSYVCCREGKQEDGHSIHINVYYYDLFAFAIPPRTSLQQIALRTTRHAKFHGPGILIKNE